MASLIDASTQGKEGGMHQPAMEHGGAGVMSSLRVAGKRTYFCEARCANQPVTARNRNALLRVMRLTLFSCKADLPLRRSSWLSSGQGYKPRISRACSTRVHAMMNAAVRKETFLSCATCHTEENASRMIRASLELISSSVQKKLEKS